MRETRSQKRKHEINENISSEEEDKSIGKGKITLNTSKFKNLNDCKCKQCNLIILTQTRQKDENI